MERKRKKWGFIVVGAVAVLTLGVIAVASAAGTQSASPSPSASAPAQAGQAHTPDFDGDGPQRDGDRGRIHGGGGDIAEALAKLSGKDVATIQSQREAGRSFAEIAKAEGVGTDELLAETTRIETAELDAAVKAGQMTAAERTQELSGLQARLQAELTETGTMKQGGGRGFGHRGGGGGDIAQALAKLSGKSESTIMSSRASGKSFAEIAKAEGVGTDELLAETTRIETAELDAAVKAGQMTDAERTQELSGLQARLQAELTETQTFGHGGHGFGHDGDGLNGSTGSGTSTGTSSSTTGAGFYGGSSSETTQTY